MQKINLTQCVRVATEAAEKASVLLLRHAGAPSKVETKRSAVDLVTEIDKAAEHLIRRELALAHRSKIFWSTQKSCITSCIFPAIRFHSLLI